MRIREPPSNRIESVVGEQRKATSEQRVSLAKVSRATASMKNKVAVQELPAEPIETLYIPL
jgi:hypothetical protein